MIKSILLSIVLFFCLNLINAQNLIFSKSAGSNTIDSDLDQGYDIITDSSGNIYVTGIMSKGTTGSIFGQGESNQTILNVNGAYIAKYNSSGDLLWAKQIEANNNGVVSNAINLDANNNILVTGYFSVEVTFGVDTATETKLYANNGSRDVFFAKYSENGDFIWAKSFGGTMDDAPGGTSIKADSDNNIYVSGSINNEVVFGEGEPYETTILANFDMFISKYTENGDLIWVRSAGSNNHVSSKNIDLDANGNIYITGNFFYDVVFAESEYNETKLNRTNEQAYIAKYDTNGKFMWAKSPYYYSNDTSNISGDIKVIDNDRIIYTGAYGTYGNTYLTNCLKLEGKVDYDAIIIQFDSNGNYIWNSTINSTSEDRGLALDVDQKGNIFVTGYFGNDVILNEGKCNESTLKNNGNSDIFIAAYDFNGQFLSATSAGGSGWDQAAGIDVDNSGNIYITGYYTQNIVFGPTEDNQTTLFKNGVNEIYLAKYNLNLSTISGTAYAGESNCIEICSNGNPIDLFDSLLNNPDTGGTWSPPLSSGTGIFDPLMDAEGVYRYIVLESNCISDYAEIAVDFSSTTFNPGEDTTINICPQNATFSLFNRIEGNPDAGGIWTPNLSSGTDMFDPLVDLPGVYTYTLQSSNCNNVSSQITVNFNTELSPGSDGTVTVCESSLGFNLFDILNGSPDTGGFWEPSLASGTGLFNPSIDKPGIYTYNIINGNCGTETSQVEVIINQFPNAGTYGSLKVCTNSSPIDLINVLNDTPDTGGIWTPALNSGTGLFDPSIDKPGIYTYMVNGICGQDTSEVNVTITNAIAISDYQIKTNEFGSNNSIEIIINSNQNYEFSLDGINYQNSNIFYSLEGGDYTIYAREVGGCGILKDMVSILDYPKFFTPNDDGFNDTWSLKGIATKNYSIYIFDRFGKLLKHLVSPDMSWDGNLNGKQLPTDDYWFKVRFNDGSIKSGHFTLKR